MTVVMMRARDSLWNSIINSRLGYGPYGIFFAHWQWSRNNVIFVSTMTMPLIEYNDLLLVIQYANVTCAYCLLASWTSYLHVWMLTSSLPPQVMSIARCNL